MKPLVTACRWSDGDIKCLIDWREERKEWTDNLWRWTVAQVNQLNEVVECTGGVVATWGEALNACRDYIREKRS